MNCGKGKCKWLMMLGCLLPIIILIAAPLLGIKNQYITWLAFLACPLAMGLMMFMNKNEKGKCNASRARLNEEER